MNTDQKIIKGFENTREEIQSTLQFLQACGLRTSHLEEMEDRLINISTKSLSDYKQLLDSIGIRTALKPLTLNMKEFWHKYSLPNFEKEARKTIDVIDNEVKETYYSEDVVEYGNYEIFIKIDASLVIIGESHGIEPIDREFVVHFKDITINECFVEFRNKDDKVVKFTITNYPYLEKKIIQEINDNINI